MVVVEVVNMILPLLAVVVHRALMPLPLVVDQPGVQAQLVHQGVRGVVIVVIMMHHHPGEVEDIALMLMKHHHHHDVGMGVVGGPRAPALMLPLLGGDLLLIRVVVVIGVLMLLLLVVRDQPGAPVMMPHPPEGDLLVLVLEALMPPHHDVDKGEMVRIVMPHPQGGRRKMIA